MGKRIGTIAQAVYGQKAQWENVSRPVPLEQLSRQAWVGPDVHMGDTALEAWMDTQRRNEHCLFRVDSTLGMHSVVRQGAGIAVLPCYLGDADEQLVKLTEPVPELSTELWLLAHQDLRRVARVRRFWTR
nr:LysR substrate-binding domain-containing protein [Alkalilimnicola ehrlichii]